MQTKKWFLLILAAAVLPLALAMPSAAQDSEVSDIALTPGADMSQLNITWHTGSATVGDACSVEVTKNPLGKKKFHWLFSFFPGFRRTFDGTWEGAGVDEYGNSDAYCKVTVDGLKSWDKYTYRLTDGAGDWSESYEYASGRYRKYGFLFVADSQIGASGPKDLSRSRDVQPYVEEYYETNDLPDGYTVDDVYALFETEYTDEGRVTDLEALSAVAPELASDILDMIADRVDAQMDASLEDTDGWVSTVDLMTRMYPKTSFIISGGDQVELKNAEWEYTGFLTPEQLTSIPVAPTYASHDRAPNFEYHFTLPNESEDYGQDSNGVGDYYFTHGDTLVMVLNMDVTNGLFPRGAPPGPPPGGGPSTDTDGDGVNDDEDQCGDTPAGAFVDDVGCPLNEGEDYDGDGVLNEDDLCSNTLAAHYEAGLISGITGCPYDDIDNDGIPDEDAEGITIDRCNNTNDNLTVDDDGCAGCDYLETDDELWAWLEELDADGDLDEFNASLAEHEAFMAEAIAASPNAKWKIVVWHYSIYSAAMHSTDDQSEGIRFFFTPMLENLDIDVVLMGHDHAYTRTHQMLDNEPQLDQIVGRRGQVINPTGVLYLTASSSSGSKYYELNCNIGDDTSDSAVYYDYAAYYDEYIPTFTYFEVDRNMLKLSSYTYLEDEETGEFDVTLIDEYAIEKKPHFWKKGKQWKGKGW